MKDDPPKHPPIVELDYLSGVTVVDIGDIRVARGMSRRPVSMCPHTPLVYDNHERRIWCKDCESDVEPFDAFLQLVENFARAADQIKRDREDLKAAQDHSILRIAAKKMDEHFRSKRHVPACPNCGEGIFPEDVAKMGMVGREWAAAKRKKKEAEKP